MTAVSPKNNGGNGGAGIGGGGGAGIGGSGSTIAIRSGTVQATGGDMGAGIGGGYGGEGSGNGTNITISGGTVTAIGGDYAAGIGGGGGYQYSAEYIGSGCIIYTGLTYEQEAELYYMLDRTRGKLRLGHATKALVESGADAEIIDVKQRIEDAGFVWALDRPTGEPFEIATTRAVINAYRLLGGAAFSRMLGLIAGVQ